MAFERTQRSKLRCIINLATYPSPNSPTDSGEEAPFLREIAMRKILCAYAALGLCLAGCGRGGEAPKPAAEFHSGTQAAAPRVANLAGIPKTEPADFDREVPADGAAFNTEAYDHLVDN